MSLFDMYASDSQSLNSNELTFSNQFQLPRLGRLGFVGGDRGRDIVDLLRYRYVEDHVCRS
jgi:hypothetical protein